VTVSEYDDLLLDAYRGELLGEGFFGALAAQCGDQDRREKLRVLARVEAHTASQLRPLVDEAGMDSRDDAAAHDDGVKLAADVTDQPWPELLASLRAVLPAFLEKFERLQAIAADPRDPVLADLVAHERAIDGFAALELEGHDADSIDVLRRHLEAAGSTRTV
jgi:hypothetical protein